MIVDIGELIKELINKKLQILGVFVWMLRRLKVLSYGVRTWIHFPIVSLLAWQIQGVVRITNKGKSFFSLVDILTNLWRCCLCLENFKIIIFVSKNWFNDPRLNCKSPRNLIKFIEINEQLEEELEEFKKGWNLKLKNLNLCIFHHAYTFASNFDFYFLIKKLVVDLFSIRGLWEPSLRTAG
jgi:hypothetical protein